jgi:hypothetical protein
VPIPAIFGTGSLCAPRVLVLLRTLGHRPMQYPIILLPFYPAQLAVALPNCLFAGDPKYTAGLYQSPRPSTCFLGDSWVKTVLPRQCPSLIGQDIYASWLGVTREKLGPCSHAARGVFPLLDEEVLLSSRNFNNPCVIKDPPVPCEASACLCPDGSPLFPRPPQSFATPISFAALSYSCLYFLLSVLKCFESVSGNFFYIYSTA